MPCHVSTIENTWPENVDSMRLVLICQKFKDKAGEKSMKIWLSRATHQVRGTSKYELCFGGDKPLLFGYTDAKMVGDVDTR